MAWWDFDNAAAASNRGRYGLSWAYGASRIVGRWSLVNSPFWRRVGDVGWPRTCFPADRIDGAINPAIK